VKEQGMNLSGKTAVITGSTSGIGLGIARKLAEAGADIVLNSFTSKPEDHQLANALAREFSVRPGIAQLICAIPKAAER
jgi:3-hydroxybutyrate dehydrogenase